jgi:ankyrin repeat protein
VRFSTLEVNQIVANEWEQGLLEMDKNGRLPLHLVVTGREKVPIGVVQFLVDKCPRSLQVRTKYGWLPLHSAVACEKPLEVVKVLARKDPRVLTEKTDEGLVPLHVAAQYRSLELVHFLFEACPLAVQVRAQDGSLPVHTAAQSGAPLEVIYFLARSWPRAVGG